MSKSKKANSSSVVNARKINPNKKVTSKKKSSQKEKPVQIPLGHFGGFLNPHWICLPLLIAILLFPPMLWKGAEVRSQNVGINATGATPDNSAMLDVLSTTKGMLIPRMTGAQKYAITTPATGLLIFQTPDTAGFWYYDGTKWLPLLSSTSSTGGSTGGWGLTGNSGTDASNFLGTTDNVSLRLRTNDTIRVVIDSIGNIGIGTTAPANKLAIIDSNSAGDGVLSRSIYNYQIRTEPNITVYTSARAGANLLLYRMTEGTPGTQGAGEGCSNTAYTDGTNTFNWLRGAHNVAYTGSTASSGQNTLAGALNQGYLNSSGNITQVFGSLNYAFNNNSGTISNAYGSSSQAYIAPTSGGSITSATGANNRVWNPSTSAGSIGTAYGTYSRIQQGGTGTIGTGYLYYGDYVGTTTTKWGIYLTGETNNYFSGNVGIGTASPTDGKLVVYGASPVLSIQNNTTTAGSGGVLRFGHNQSGSSLPVAEIRSYLKDGSAGFRAGNMTFWTSDAGVLNERMCILKDGNVGINCTDPQYKLHVVGDIASSATIRGVNAYVTGAITACSDIRYKKDITPLPNALNNVMKLQGVNYLWKAKEFPDKNFTNDKQIGFIAQELEKILPEVVMTDKDGYKSVDYSRLTPVLVEAIKEQQKLIDKEQLIINNMKAEIEILKAENQDTKAEVEGLRILIKK